MKTKLIMVVAIGSLILGAFTGGSTAFAGGTSDEAEFANVDRPPLSDKWNLIVGTEQYVEDFAAQHTCVTAIWQRSNVNGWEFWRAYFPKSLEDNDKFYFRIQYMFVDEAYWVYCDGGES